MRFNTIPLFVACMHCFIIDIAQICVTILLKVPFDKKQHWLTPEADDIHGKTFRQKEDGVKHDETKHRNKEISKWRILFRAPPQPKVISLTNVTVEGCFAEPPLSRNIPFQPIKVSLFSANTRIHFN